jgi:CheY-like chemotaxis protein
LHLLLETAPFLDGLEVSKKIQQNPSDAKQLKGVFAITAGGEKTNFIPQGESLASIGFDGWFVKPVTQAQIVGLLQEDYSSSSSKTEEPQLITAKIEQSKQPTAAQADPESSWDTFDQVPVQFHALMDSFLSEMRDGLTEMGSLNKANNGFALAAKAHYLKGNCMLFQLDKMVNLLGGVEKSVKNEKLPQVKQQKVEQALEKLQFSLKYLEK